MSSLQMQQNSSGTVSAIDRSVIRDGARTLEEILLALAKYGKPRIAHDGDGWFCAVEMYVTAAGVNFKVASEFSRPSPIEAAKQCAQRLDKALSDIGA